MEAGYQLLQIRRSSSSRLSLSTPDLPKMPAYTLKPGLPTPGQPNLLRPPFALNQGIGIFTDFPSATLLSLALGADSPCADERCAGNLGLSVREPFTPFIATHVSIRTSDTSSIPHRTPSQAYRTLSYHLNAPFRTRPRLSFAPLARTTNLQLR